MTRMPVRPTVNLNPARRDRDPVGLGLLPPAPAATPGRGSAKRPGPRLQCGGPSHRGTVTVALARCTLTLRLSGSGGST